MGTLGAYAESYTCPTLQEEALVFQSPWKKQLEDFRERFDIDRDLGGLAVARIWGMDFWQGFLAMAFTLHPGDMVEYTTTAEERTTLIITPVKPDEQAHDITPILQISPKQTPELVSEKRKLILEFTLGSETKNQYNDAWSQKLLYAASLCAITCCHDEHLLSLAHLVLEKLESATGADLTEEKSRCTATESLTVGPKSAAQLNGPGGTLFERCSICDTGIEWYSATEAQCEEGHVFGKSHCPYVLLVEPLLTNSSALRLNFPLYSRTRDIKILLCVRDRVSK